MAVNEVLARNLRRFRGDRALSLGEVSRASGLAKQTIRDIENGRSNPTIDTLERVANALGTTIRALLSELGTDVWVQTGRDARWQQRTGALLRKLDEVFGSGFAFNTVVHLTAESPPFLAPAHERAALRHCYVVEGTVRIGPTSESVVAESGDFVRFPADVDHVFEALTPFAVVFVNTTVPQRSTVGGTRAF